MRIYIFKSEKSNHLGAFAGDRSGAPLPDSHGPWRVTDIIGPAQDLPYKLSRKLIEQAIAEKGYQLWRMKAKPAEPRRLQRVARADADQVESEQSPRPRIKSGAGSEVRA